MTTIAKLFSKLVLYLFLKLLRLQFAVRSRLLLRSLESTVAHLTRSIDKLERDLLSRNTSSLLEQGLSQRNESLSRAHDGTLDHDVVVLDNTVVTKAAHRGDFLLSRVVVSVRAERRFVRFTNLVNLLVDFRSVVITVLTWTSDRVRNSRRVPRTDARNLTQTSVSLTRQTGDAPTGDDAFETFTLGDGNDVNHFVLLEDGVNRDSLLKELETKVNLVRDRATVDLNFHHVRLLLLQVLHFSNLRVRDDSDDVARLFQRFQILFDGAVRVLLRVLLERLLLGLEPVLVESTLDFVGQVFRPHRLDASQTLRRSSVADETDDDHLRALDNSHRFARFLLVQLGTRLVHISDDVRHAGFETHKGSQVRRLGRIILREGFHLTSGALGSLLRQKTQVTKTGICCLNSERRKRKCQ